MATRTSQHGSSRASNPNEEVLAAEQELAVLTNEGQSSRTQAIDREYVPPDGGYGWVCVGCVFLVNAHTWGLNFVSETFLFIHATTDHISVLLWSWQHSSC